MNHPNILVNFFGGPAIGKSNCARSLCSLLSEFGISNEYVPEFAKKLTWKSDLNTRSNQVFVTATQFDDILTVYDKVSVTVTDGPLILGMVYPGPCCTPVWKEHVIEMHNYFNNINIFIQRNNEWYQPIGRTQTLEECISADQRTLDFLNQYQIDYVTIPADRHMSSRVFDVLMEKIKNEKTHT